MEDCRGSQHGATSSPLPACVRLEARVLVPRVVGWEAVTGAGRVRAAGGGEVVRTEAARKHLTARAGMRRTGMVKPLRADWGRRRVRPALTGELGGSRAGPG